MGGFSPLIGLIAALAAFDAAAVVVPGAACSGSRRLGSMTYITDGSAGAAASVVACVQAEAVLAEHGWRAPHAVVRIEENPFDATAMPAEIALSSAAAPEDNAFELTEALLRRSLAAATRAAPVDVLATVVASRLSVPPAARRAAIEAAWLDRVGRGDILTTALPELLWRTGGDRAIRSAVAGEWPATAIAVLRELGCEDPLGAAGELLLAALLEPASLGLTTQPLRLAALAAVARSSEVSLDAPGARYVVLPTGSGAVGVEPLRSNDGAAAWLAVRYSLTGDYDAVRLSEGHELAAPMQGVEWAAVVVVSLAPAARVSLNLRAIADFPQQVSRWDFVATHGAANLAWETENHRSLSAYVVEALSHAADGTWSVVKRVILPVADDGDAPYSYAFVDPESDDIAAYRLLALTDEGLLGEVSTFPVPAD